MSIPIIVITLSIIFCLYLIHIFTWKAGYKVGVEKGRKQILEENLKRENIKLRSLNAPDTIENIIEGKKILLRGSQC